MIDDFDRAGTTRPCLGAALPALYEPYLPMNATSLLLEWEASIDPVGALVSRAIRGGEHAWLLMEAQWRRTDKFVCPTYTTTELLRDAAEKEELINAFKESGAQVHMGAIGRWAYVRSLVTPDDKLSMEATPVLVGLALGAAITMPIGTKGMEIMAKLFENEECDWYAEADEKD